MHTQTTVHWWHSHLNTHTNTDWGVVGLRWDWTHEFVGGDRSSLPVYRGEELISASAALQSSQITSISQVCVCLNRVVVLEPHPVKILQLTLWRALRDTCSQFFFLKILHSYLRSLYRYLSAFMSKFIISNGLINEGRLSKWQTLQLDFQSEPTVSVVIEKSAWERLKWI